MIDFLDYSYKKTLFPINRLGKYIDNSGIYIYKFKAMFLAF